MGLGKVPGIQAVGDLNGDGNIDLLATTANSVLALLRDGHGNFNPVLTTEEPFSGVPRAIGDLNNDGAADVASRWVGHRWGSCWVQATARLALQSGSARAGHTPGGLVSRIGMVMAAQTSRS